ncbi:MAG TPA: CheR family methyltransferase [Isosphaeraceae bacterium]|nr:CheR family methyltransferase [Isosphaeraceae bacterium]
MSGGLKKILELLGHRIGLDPVAVGADLVLRAAQRRMIELDLDDLAVYAARADQVETELQSLIEEVVVPESWFFRDERPFRWLGDSARDRWLNQPARPPLRILSLACAGGEEPYSIAITLRDLGLPADRFRIDAVDVSTRRLAIARRGVYSLNAFRGPRLGGRARHFRAHPQGYELDPAIRATVRLIQGNVLDSRLLADVPPYDVVFCRNLLIYLDASARARVVAALDRLLAADGTLIIGHADRLELAGVPPRFAPVGEPGCFAYRKTTSRMAGDSREAGGERREAGEDREDGLPLPAAHDAAPATHDTGPATDSAAPVTRHPPPATQDLLEQAAELANQGRHAEAITACQRHVQLKGPSAGAYSLMGMIYQAAGDRRRAEDCFNKAVYLDPKHEDALLALALLAERRGDRDAAVRFRRRARNTAPSPPIRPQGSESR